MDPSVKTKEEMEPVESKELDTGEDKVRESYHNYVWASPFTSGDMVTLTGGLTEMSVYAAGEHLLRSHVFSALGACLYEGKSMIIWMDYPMEILKTHGIKVETKRIYWNSSFKTRGYSCLKFGEQLFGLSEACQEFRIKDDLILKKFGLELKEGYFPFQMQDWKRKIRYLEINIDEVTKEPTTTNIKKWLKIDEKKEEKGRKAQEDLRLRQDAL